MTGGTEDAAQRPWRPFGSWRRYRQGQSPWHIRAPHPQQQMSSSCLATAQTRRTEGESGGNPGGNSRQGARWPCSPPLPLLPNRISHTWILNMLPQMLKHFCFSFYRQCLYSLFNVTLQRNYLSGLPAELMFLRGTEGGAVARADPRNTQLRGPRLSTAWSGLGFLICTMGLIAPISRTVERTEELLLQNTKCHVQHGACRGQLITNYQNCCCCYCNSSG